MLHKMFILNFLLLFFFTSTEFSMHLFLSTSSSNFFLFFIFASVRYIVTVSFVQTLLSSESVITKILKQNYQKQGVIKQQPAKTEVD